MNKGSHVLVIDNQQQKTTSKKRENNRKSPHQPSRNPPERKEKEFGNQFRRWLAKKKEQVERGIEEWRLGLMQEDRRGGW